MFGFKKEEYQVQAVQEPRRGFWATKKNLGGFVAWVQSEFTAAQLRIADLEQILSDLSDELEALQKDHKAYYDEASELRRKLITLTREYQASEARLNRYREAEETISRREEIKDQVTEALIGLGLGTAKAGGCKCKK